MKKKIALLLCCAGLLLALSGCGATDQPTNLPADQADVQNDEQTKNEQAGNADQDNLAVDPAIEELYNNNALLDILDGHSTVSYKTVITSDIGSEISNTQSLFRREDGLLRLDALSSYSDGTTSAMQGVQLPDHAPALYIYSDTYKSLTICPAADYEQCVLGQWLMNQATPGEIVEDQEEQDGQLLLHTRRDDADMGGYYLNTYTLDQESGLIQAKDVAFYVGEDELIYESKTSFAYDEDPGLEVDATTAILKMSENCELTMIVDPGDANEEQQTFLVAHDTNVYFFSNRGYKTYTAEDGQFELTYYDVTGDSTTIFALPR